MSKSQKIFMANPKNKHNVKIIMLKSARGADEHIHVKNFLEGKEYEVSDCLADSFVNSGDAVFKEEHEKQKQLHANKALTEENYQNKSDKRRDK